MCPEMYQSTHTFAKQAGQLILLICITAILAACSMDEAQSTEEGWSRYAHQNGLSLCLPQSLIVESSATGFTIYPNRTQEQYRLPLEVSVSLEPGQMNSQANWLQSWPFFNNVHYRIDEEEGGSGGVGYRLTAWQQMGDSHIVYRQFTQADGTKPDFSLAWQVIKASGSDNRCTQQDL